jgi:hypothetical protein
MCTRYAGYLKKRTGTQRKGDLTMPDFPAPAKKVLLARAHEIETGNLTAVLLSIGTRIVVFGHPALVKYVEEHRAQVRNVAHPVVFRVWRWMPRRNKQDLVKQPGTNWGLRRGTVLVEKSLLPPESE